MADTHRIKKVRVQHTMGSLVISNAPDEDHWYFKLAEIERPEDWSFFRQPGGVFKDGEDWKINEDAENLINLPDGYYKRGLNGKTNDWIKVNLANEYGFGV